MPEHTGRFCESNSRPHSTVNKATNAKHPSMHHETLRKVTAHHGCWGLTGAGFNLPVGIGAPADLKKPVVLHRLSITTYGDYTISGLQLKSTHGKDGIELELLSESFRAYKEDPKKPFFPPGDLQPISFTDLGEGHRRWDFDFADAPIAFNLEGAFIIGFVDVLYSKALIKPKDIDAPQILCSTNAPVRAQTIQEWVQGCPPFRCGLGELFSDRVFILNCDYQVSFERQESSQMPASDVACLHRVDNAI